MNCMRFTVLNKYYCQANEEKKQTNKKKNELTDGNEQQNKYII